MDQLRKLTAAVITIQLNQIKVKVLNNARSTPSERLGTFLKKLYY